MALQLPRKQSLKTRVLVFVLIVFIVSIWLLTIGARYWLRSDIELMLGKQQMATVSLVASEINSSFDLRFDLLRSISNEISAADIRNPQQVQRKLESHPSIPHLFNAGAFVTRFDGKAIAESPKIGRIGLFYLDKDHIAAALQEGKATVGKPNIGKRVRKPSFAITVPIRDAQGDVIGALTGATDLSQANFLDNISDSSYGSSGGYLVVDPDHRLFVTTTSNNKDLIMRPLPAPGVNTVLDRRLLGFDDYAININSLGIEVLTSSSRIPSAGWFVISSLPTREAFAPIRDFTKKLYLSAFVLTLVALGLTWWMLNRLLTPMQTAALAIRSMVTTGKKEISLPGAFNDEVGELITSFNTLMRVSNERDLALKESEARFRSFFEKNLSVMLLIRPSDGQILDANHSAVLYYGYDQNELRQKHIHELNILPAEACAIEMADAVRETRNYFQFKHRLASGEIRDIEVYSTPIRSHDQVILFTSIHDVTNRVALEVALSKNQAQLARVMEGTDEGFWERNLETQEVQVSARFETMLGYKPGEWVRSHENWLKDVHPDDVDSSMRSFDEHIQGKTHQFRAEYRIRHTSGKWIWILSKGKVCKRNDQGQPVLIAGTLTDISREKQAEATLKVMNQDFVKILETSIDFMYFKDRDSRIRYCSQSMARITGFASWRDMVGKHDRDIFPPDVAAIYSNEEAQIFSDGFAVLNKINPYYKADKTLGWVSTNKWPLFSEDGKTVIGLFGISRDITEFKRQEEELKVLASTDFLTGVEVRRNLVSAIDSELSRLQRDAAYRSAILMFDLDHFKNVNDTYGHAAGDEVLKHIAGLVRGEIRKVDRIGRLGGEEFAIVMPGADLASAGIFADRFRNKVEVNPVQVGGQSIPVTVSIGVTQLKVSDMNSTTALERVDQAMYQAKNEGRNRVVVTS